MSGTEEPAKVIDRAPPSCAKLLGNQLTETASQAVKKHEKGRPADSEGDAAAQAHLDKCVATLELMAEVYEIFRCTEQVYMKLLPEQLEVTDPNGTKEIYSLHSLDIEGRPIYKGSGPPEEAFLRWCKGQQGGCWAARTCADGKGAGCMQFDSPWPWDMGVWQLPGDSGPATSAECIPTGSKLISDQDRRQLADCWGAGATAAEVCKKALPILNASGMGEQQVRSGGTVLVMLQRLLMAMCNVAGKLQLDRCSDMEPPREPTWGAVVASAQSLMGLCDAGVWSKLSAALPAFDMKYEVTWVNCMVYMCRIIAVSDLRNPSESCVLAFCHRLFLRGWQERHVGEAEVINLVERSCTVSVPAALRPSDADKCLRCAIISDTHGWDSELRLPPGQILFHCGDFLFEGGAVGKDGTPPEELEAAMRTLHQEPFKSFKWIFAIGGNHDRSLHHLWAHHPEKLNGMLPGNLVLLQVPADLTPKLSTFVAAKDADTRSKVADGAVRLLPDGTICRPDFQEDSGWVIAGSGVSLANSAGSGNCAFQLLKGDTDALHRNAASLMKHKPEIIMTHGPPKGHRDSNGKGDEALATQVKGSPNAMIHMFGHLHESHGADFDGNRVFVNASMTSPLYFPAQWSFVFDLKFDPATTASCERRESAKPKTKVSFCSLL